ncbi:MAG TPA: hypothetical protein VNK43_05725 [Gemmatimonadales bacterium]|nr:hypothetical protein [Gemmatimonadales bacterium]
MPPESTAGPSPSPPDRRALAEAARELVRAEVERQAAEARAVATRAAPRRWLRPVLAVLLLTAAGYLWLADPPWLTSATVAAEPPEVRRAGLRLGLFLESQRVEAFRRARGRLPHSAAELGGARPGIEYRRLDEHTYELTATGDGTRETYHSSIPAERMLGHSLEVLTPVREAP